MKFGYTIILSYAFQIFADSAQKIADSASTEQLHKANYFHANLLWYKKL